MSITRRIACRLGELHDVDPELVLAGRRGKNMTDVVCVQHELVWLARRFEAPQMDVARAIGKHHGTVQNSIRFVERMAEDPDAFRALDDLAEQLRWSFERGDAMRAALEAASAEVRRAKRKER